MRVLWSVNCVFPNLANKVGLKSGHAVSWVDAMKTALSDNHPEVELAIVCNCERGVKELLKHRDGSIAYYMLPANSHRQKNWEKIIDEFCPEVIHAYGTETTHNITLIERYKHKIPIIISLQGIISEYVRHYYAHMPAKDIILNYTLCDILSRRGIFEGKRAFAKQSKKEQKMLCSVRYVEGRSDWDKAVSLNINPDLKYYNCPRMLRKPFFEYRWDKENHEPHSLFVHQGGYPIKGLHFMIDALDIISKKYPDVKLYVSGNSFINKKGLREHGYPRYIRKKINKLGLKDRIVFTGYLSADELAKKLSKINICIIPSAIENAPNALAEAMCVGTPCIASYVGGNAQMLDYGKLGLLYSYYEPQLLAQRIDDLFMNPEKAADFSEKGQTFVREKHKPAVLEETLLGIYADVIESFNRQ